MLIFIKVLQVILLSVEIQYKTKSKTQLVLLQRLGWQLTYSYNSEISRFSRIFLVQMIKVKILLFRFRVQL